MGIDEDRHTELVRRAAHSLVLLAAPATEAEGATGIGDALRDRYLIDKANGLPTDDHEASDAAARELLSAAIATLQTDLNVLCSIWVERLITVVQQIHVDTEARVAALRAGQPLPAFEFGLVTLMGNLQRAIHAAGDRVDPHLPRLAAAFGTAGRNGDDWLPDAMSRAGPGLANVVPALFGVLRAHGVWSSRPGIRDALARAATFEPSVAPTLRQMLNSDDPAHRKSAASVLAALGDAAKPAAEQLQASESGDEGERCGGLYALARQRPPTPATMGVIERALRDANGYVRRSAVYAAGELRADPERFLPLLITACDDPESLHDQTVPEAAVDALGKYGPAARPAVPRLLSLLDGPIASRTVDPKAVRAALSAITGHVPLARSTAIVRATPVTADEPLFAVAHEGRLCYVDRSGTVALATPFDHGQPFHGDRAIVRRGRETFVIDRAGQVVFRSDWRKIRPFSEGMAAIRQDDLWGFVDRDGRVIVEPAYSSVTRYAEGMAGVELGRTKIPFGKSAMLDRPGRRGFIDRVGAVAIPIEFEDVEPFSHGRATVCLGSTLKPNPLLGGRELPSDRRYGLLDRDGRIIVDGRYGGIGPFLEGLAAVHTGDGFLRGRHGYVDVDGREVIPLVYKSAGPFRDGLAMVKRRGRKNRAKKFILDRSGKVVGEIDRQLGWHGFSEGLTAAYFGGLWGVIDVTGQTVVEPQFDDVGPFTHGIAAVSRGKWNGLIDRDGKFIWGPTEAWVHTSHSTLESEWS